MTSRPDSAWLAAFISQHGGYSLSGPAFDGTTHIGLIQIKKNATSSSQGFNQLQITQLHMCLLKCNNIAYDVLPEFEANLEHCARYV